MRWIMGLHMSLHDVFSFERLGTNRTLNVRMIRGHVLLKIRPAFEDGIAMSMAAMVPVGVWIKKTREDF